MWGQLPDQHQLSAALQQEMGDLRNHQEVTTEGCGGRSSSWRSIGNCLHVVIISAGLEAPVFEDEQAWGGGAVAEPVLSSEEGVCAVGASNA